MQIIQQIRILMGQSDVRVTAQANVTFPKVTIQSDYPKVTFEKCILKLEPKQ